MVRILHASGVKIEWDRARRRRRVRADRRGLPIALIDSVNEPRRAERSGHDAHRRRLCEHQRQAAQAIRSLCELPSGLELAGVPSRYPGIDLVIIRENTEDLYAGLEHEVVPGVVESLKIITENASTRIARFAFEYARRHQRKKITPSTRRTS